ncbi:MAG: hypothetical protein NC489_37085 [Ruminococcus flavefaciens]|nr:hypothetical protein [Ruminococcus flavefaciens]
MPGDTRIVTRFLFLPLRINCQWRWLELVKIHQSYGTITNHWSNDWFIDKEDPEWKN